MKNKGALQSFVFVILFVFYPLNKDYIISFIVAHEKKKTCKECAIAHKELSKTSKETRRNNILKSLLATRIYIII